jgi:hypothetical protein
MDTSQMCRRLSLPPLVSCCPDPDHLSPHTSWLWEEGGNRVHGAGDIGDDHDRAPHSPPTSHTHRCRTSRASPLLLRCRSAGMTRTGKLIDLDRDEGAASDEGPAMRNPP